MSVKRSRFLRAFTERGVATVEFAIVLPLILFLILAVAELGRGFIQYNALTRAARDAVRYVASNALFGQTQTVQLTSDLRTNAANVLVYGTSNAVGQPLLPGLSPANVTLTDLGENNVRLTVAYAYQPLIGPLVPGLQSPNSIGGAFTMRAAVTMRAL